MPRAEVGSEGPASGRWAWGLVLTVVLCWALAALLAWAGVAQSAGPDGTAPGPLGDRADEDRRVVLVGVPGLTWDVVDEERAPGLMAMARDGGAAALVVRGRDEVTCTADAWLTLGAGQRAGTDLRSCGGRGSGAGGAGPGSVAEVVTDAGVAAEVWAGWQEAAGQEALGPRLGSLAALAEQAGTCVSAQGREAVIGAAGPDGAVASVTEEGAVEVGPCRIHLVSGPEILDGDRSDRVPGLDAAVSDLLARVPDGTTVVVAGMGQTSGRGEAQVLLVSPARSADGGGGALSSGTTRQQGLVQLTDLTPTLLALSGADSVADPGNPGGPASPGGPVDPGDPADLAGAPVTVTATAGDHVAEVRDLADGITTAKWQTPYVLGTLLTVVLVLLALSLALRGWAGRRGLPLTALVGTLALATPVAAFLAGLVPWWRAAQPWPAGVGVVLGGALLVAALAWAGPWRRHPLGPPATVAAVTAVVLGVDVLWSAPLGLVSVLGLQPVTAGRFYGQGNVGFGILLAAVLVLLAAVLATVGHAGVRSRPRAATVVTLGLAAVLLTAAPGGGADFGGVPALAVTTGLLTLTALGTRWTAVSTVAVLVVGGLVGAAAMVLDWLRGPDSWTHLGGFVQSVLDGEAAGIVGRKLAQSLGILLDYPLSWFAVLALVGVAVVAVRRPRWSAPLWDVPSFASVVLTALVAMALTWALNDSGIAAVALTLAMLIATAVSVLGRHRAGATVG